MDKTGWFGVAAGAALSVAVPLSSLAQDPTVDRLLASQCAQCHGTDGYAVGDIDELAGEDFTDLREDLLDMQSKDRPDDMMDHQALGYTDAQVRRIARYFATLDENPPPGTPAILLRPTDGVGNDDGEESEDDDSAFEYERYGAADSDRSYDWDEDDEDEEEEEEDEEDEDDEEEG